MSHSPWQREEIDAGSEEQRPMRPRARESPRPTVRVLAAALLLACGWIPACSDGHGTRTVSFQEFRAGIKAAGIWEGGPVDRYESVGRHTLAAAIEYGLMPEHRVLDVGAGSLRVGWWLLQYIDPSNYHAIEPVKNRIDTAADILGVDINIYYNDDFEFPDEAFDFVIARSIWTHASKAMISKMLAEFAENSSANARFLTSVIFAESEQEDYQGDQWVGRVLKSDRAGVVKHSAEWIREECARYGLALDVKQELHHQTWLLITKQRG